MANNRIIQGENSNHIKYQPGLCKNCNSTQSQPQDFTYVIFMDYVLAPNHTLQMTQPIDLGQVAAGHDTQLSLNLSAYLQKPSVANWRNRAKDHHLSLRDFCWGKAARPDCS